MKYDIITYAVWRYSRRDGPASLSSCGRIIALAAALTVFVLSPRSAAAAFDAPLAADNISSEFLYWPKKNNDAFEFKIPGGHSYRVKRGQTIATFGGKVTVGDQQADTQTGGLQYIFAMDHIIANADDDNAAINMYFGADGSLIGMSVVLEPSKGFIIPGAINAGGKLIVGAIAGSQGKGKAEAVDTTAKAADDLLDKLNKTVSPHGGSSLFPAEIAAMAQTIIKSVQAAAHGTRLQHGSAPIQGWKGNNCGQEAIGSIDASRRSMKLTEGQQPFANDQLRSIRIYNNTPKGTLIQLFDDSGGSHSKDDWAEIVVDDPKAFQGVGECVATFQVNRQSAGLRVFYHRQKGNGNLDGKVSRISIFPPAQWPVGGGMQ